VDADGAGRFLPAALSRFGTRCVHVKSAYPHLRLEHGQHGIGTEVRHTGDVAATVVALRELGVDHVVAGTDSGVELADVLAAELGVCGNGMRYPKSRRNKYDMAKALQAAGLAAPDVCFSASAPEIVAWATARGQWPVVLKPTESSGADNVYFCGSADEVRTACARILASTDPFGRPNDGVLAQQFLDGEEYFINTVSRDGVHHIGEIWRYRKVWARPDRRVYDYEYPVPADEAGAVAVAGYTLAMLDALELRNAPAHVEVMLTRDGPVLVECNSRLCGAQLPDVVSRCFGTNQVELTALSIARPAEFARLAGTPYRLDTNLRYVSLINPRPGMVPLARTLAPVRALPSYAAMAMRLPEGLPLPATVDLFTSPGFVYLLADDPVQLESDYRRLRELEADTLYERQTTAALPPQAGLATTMDGPARVGRVSVTVKPPALSRQENSASVRFLPPGLTSMFRSENLPAQPWPGGAITHSITSSLVSSVQTARTLRSSVVASSSSCPSSTFLSKYASPPAGTPSR
jgi:biotin carboxylase